MHVISIPTRCRGDADDVARVGGGGGELQAPCSTSFSLCGSSMVLLPGYRDRMKEGLAPRSWYVALRHGRLESYSSERTSLRTLRFVWGVDSAVFCPSLGLGLLQCEGEGGRGRGKDKITAVDLQVSCWAGDPFDTFCSLSSHWGCYFPIFEGYLSGFLYQRWGAWRGDGAR